jgi:Tfp pilus assembly protein PilZ
MTRRLRLTLPDARALRDEYQRNMARGGAFVPTAESFELREIVEVELHLLSSGASLVEEAEVVQCLGPEQAVSAGVQGVAVQFLGEPGELRARMKTLLGSAEGGESAAVETDHARLGAPALGGVAALGRDEPLAGFDPSVRDLAPEAETEPSPGGPDASDDPLATVSDRRKAPRAPVRLRARLRGGHVTLEGLTRDLSADGVLISVDATELPVGQAVRLELSNAISGERLEVAGTISRHLHSEGAPVAVAVRFDVEAVGAGRLAAFVAGVKEAETERILGGISGVIEELGLPNLLQMLCKSSPAGTLNVACGSEEGVVAFEKGLLRYVRLAGLRGGKALVRMLSWQTGTFAFHAQVESLEQEDAPVSVDAALLDAMRRLDEAKRGDFAAPRPSATFQVDREALAGESSASKTEEAVLDLAAAGFTLRRILDVIPESDAEILSALHSLEERGILLRRDG